MPSVFSEVAFFFFCFSYLFCSCDGLGGSCVNEKLPSWPDNSDFHCWNWEFFLILHLLKREVYFFPPSDNNWKAGYFYTEGMLRVKVQRVASSPAPAFPLHGTCSRHFWCHAIVIPRQIFAVPSYAVVNEGHIFSLVDSFQIEGTNCIWNDAKNAKTTKEEWETSRLWLMLILAHTPVLRAVW